MILLSPMSGMKVTQCGYESNFMNNTWFTTPIFASFLPDVLWDPTDLIRRRETPFEEVTGRTVLSSDGLLAEVSGVLLCSKSNARRSVHSLRDHFIITLIISGRGHWRDTRGKGPLWHRHTGLKPFWLQPMAPWTIDIRKLSAWAWRHEMIDSNS